MTRHLPRRHTPLFERLWTLHNPRHGAQFTPARWIKDSFGGVMAFTNVDHIRQYTVHHVNRNDWKTCADRAATEAAFKPGSIVYGYYSDPNEVLAILSDGTWDFRWRYEPYIRPQLPRRRDLRSRPKFVKGRLSDVDLEIPF